MLPIYVVNNFGQFNHLILRMLRDLDIDAKMVPNTMPPRKLPAGAAGWCSAEDLTSPVRGIPGSICISGSRFSGYASVSISLPGNFVGWSPKADWAVMALSMLRSWSMARS